MDITPAGNQIAFQQFLLRYQVGYTKDVPSFWTQFATEVPSSTAMNVYGWMDFIAGKMRVWYGERYVRNLVSRNYTLTNLLYELTVEVPRTTIEDDQYGLYGPKFEMMGRQAKAWPDDQLFAALINGGAATSVAFDGLPFFSSTHPVDPSAGASGPLGVQSNDFGLALTAPNFVTVLAAAKGFRGRDGLPLGTFANGRPLLIVGPALEKTARDLLSANFLSPTATWGAAAASAPSENTMAHQEYLGAATIMVAPWITSSTQWDMLDTSFGIMPFIWQLRQSPQMQTRTADSDEPVFANDVFQFGLRARGVPGYGLPFLAVRGNS